MVLWLMGVMDAAELWIWGMGRYGGWSRPAALPCPDGRRMNPSRVCQQCMFFFISLSLFVTRGISLTPLSSVGH